MKTYALIYNENIVGYRSFSNDWDASGVAHKFDWQPVYHIIPSYNSNTQSISESGWLIVDSGVNVYYNVNDIDLAPLIYQAQQKVDYEAEIARLKWITDGAGQAMEYIESEKEAKKVLDIYETGGSVESGNANYPMVQAELLAYHNNGQTKNMKQTASGMNSLSMGWKSVGAEIKRIRRTAKIELESVSGVNDINNILNNLSYPSPY